MGSQYNGDVWALKVPVEGLGTLDHPKIWMVDDDDDDLHYCLPRELSPTWKCGGACEEAIAVQVSPRAILEQSDKRLQMMILSQGSVTQHLQLLTGAPIHLELRGMTEVEYSPDFPSGVDLIPQPLLQREVLLRGTSQSGAEGGQSEAAAGPGLVWATSWWCKATVDRYLAETNQSMWTSLSKGRIELHRQIRQVYLGPSDQLASLFEEPPPYWGRHYLFWHQGRPLTVIFEAFSPALSAYLGPQHCASLGGRATAGPNGQDWEQSVSGTSKSSR